MKHIISIGKTYQHENGDEYEVVKLSRDHVTLETSDDAIVHMDLDEFTGELDEGAFLQVVYEDAEDEGDDADEDVED